jgi:hypothetical protein
MNYLTRGIASTIVRPRVTPDDDQAVALQRKFDALNYQPVNGFHKDRRQTRLSRPATRWSTSTRTP